MSAQAFRRYAVVAAPIVAAIGIVIGTFVDPDIGGDGVELAREYAENPGRIQVSALALHFAYALLAVPAAALIVGVRERGAWLANLAGVLFVLGMTTLPGFLLIDFVDLAVYDYGGAEAYEAVTDRIEELSAANVMFATGFFGFFLTLPVALLGAWRGGRMPWWPALVVSAGLIAAQWSPDEGMGLLVWAAALLILAWALWRYWYSARGGAQFAR